MIVLGIETATQSVGCAIGGQEGVLASFQAARGRRHAETLAPAIRFTCEQAGVALREVRVVAVDVGPGLFTGLRVGIATAKAMAHALRVPMIGLSSLDLLAHGVRESDRLIASVIDARRGEVYWALYRQVPGGVQRLTPPAIGPAADVASELQARDEDALLVGDGAARYAAELQGDGAVLARVSAHHPSAAALVELAQPKALREEFVPHWELEPIYLRKSDAEIAWDRSG